MLCRAVWFCRARLRARPNNNVYKRYTYLGQEKSRIFRVPKPSFLYYAHRVVDTMVISLEFRILSIAMTSRRFVLRCALWRSRLRRRLMSNSITQIAPFRMLTKFSASSTRNTVVRSPKTGSKASPLSSEPTSSPSLNGTEAPCSGNATTRNSAPTHFLLNGAALRCFQLVGA